MAQFFGTVKGQRGLASRLGSKASNLRVEACSWQGKVTTYLWYDAEMGKDRYLIRMEPHKGNGATHEIASGIVGE